MSVLVWIEQSNSSPVGSSFEVLGKAREIAGALGTQSVAVLIGADAAAAETVRTYGADTVLTVSSPVLANYRLSAYVKALRKAVEAAGATVVLMAATVRGREVAAVLGSELDAGYAPDAVDLRVDDGKLVAVRSVYSNNILADVTFNSPVQVVSVRQRSFPMPEPGAASGEVKAVDAGLSESDVLEKLVEIKSTDTGEVSLTDASIIVSGGRGVSADPAKGFELVVQLASALGAAVGASRAAVDAGYIPYKHQVGQTGKTVKPDLYIAAGISGAIQHLAGMGGSKLIVAINKDGEAPIFEKANYGIVGDLYQVLPALTAEFKKRLGK
ncbi:electron transfer flavoprotein subunit alpha/FixB family protein [Caldilinea sp.]|uniref:electron transfer flavoprotein subunit alpha/FixB family protein n=1 Tax=Caldilinea sp. TaxID=2293560 RepID=UPI002CA8139A|nr:electron transfer flavoprotein subunit alpha/FixB family protein [Anaerolineales bacterium]HQY90433.1 electron transfer flavoprotein subunit alpha/FixB family protein [Caldilinea sp.]